MRGRSRQEFESCVPLSAPRGETLQLQATLLKRGGFLPCFGALVKLGLGAGSVFASLFLLALSPRPTAGSLRL